MFILRVSKKLYDSSIFIYTSIELYYASETRRVSEDAGSIAFSIVSRAGGEREAFVFFHDYGNSSFVAAD